MAGDERATGKVLLADRFARRGSAGQLLRRLPPSARYLMLLSVSVGTLGIAAAEVLPASPNSGDPRAVDCSTPDSVWRRSKVPSIAAYCDHVALGRSALDSDPGRALLRAAKAQRLLPNGIDALSLRAEATLLSGQVEEAERCFATWIERLSEAETARLPIATTISVGRAALLSGKYASALSWYRRAVLGIDRLAGPRQRARVLIEAAIVAGYQDPPLGDEARSYLRLAERQNAPLLREVLLGAWTASWLRDGQPVQAVEKARELGGSWALSYVLSAHPVSLGRSNEILPVLPEGEGAAMCLAVAHLIEPDVKSLHAERFFGQVDRLTPPRHILSLAKRWESAGP